MASKELIYGEQTAKSSGAKEQHEPFRSEVVLGSPSPSRPPHIIADSLVSIAFLTGDPSLADRIRLPSGVKVTMSGRYPAVSTWTSSSQKPHLYGREKIRWMDNFCWPESEWFWDGGGWLSFTIDTAAFDRCPMLVRCIWATTRSAEELFLRLAESECARNTGVAVDVWVRQRPRGHSCKEFFVDLDALGSAVPRMR